MINERDKRLRMWLWILIILLIGILFFGLRPKDFRFENGVAWLKDRPGIRFSENGLAFTKGFLKKVGIDAFRDNGFSIEIALKSSDHKGGNFGFILSIHDGDDRDQMLVGQWRSHIIVMNGDDYSHKRKNPRISVDTASQQDQSIFLTITTGRQGTRMYVNGQIAKSDSKLTLMLPSGGNPRLTLGNSVYGNNPWEGEIHGLALYGHVLTDHEVASHFERWSTAKSFTFAGTHRPALLYTFEEGQGTHVQDLSGNGEHFEMPKKMRALQKRILAVPWHNLEFNRGLYADLSANLVGFIPLGLVLFVILSLFRGQIDKNVMLLTVLLCFLLSLGIEIAQAWIPSRSSSLHDLVLNTVGGWLGALLGTKNRRA